MTADQIYRILCDIVKGVSLRDSSIKTLPDQIEAKAKLTEFGLNVTILPEILGEMKERMGGADLNVGALFTQEALNQCTLADLVSTLHSNSKNSPVGKIVVYVDDEEENLFIFKRKYGKRFNLKTFTNSMEALSFIQKNNDVGLRGFPHRK